MSLTLETLMQSLEGAGCYRTPADVDKWVWDRLFGGIDFWLHSRILGVVSGGCRDAYAGKFDRFSWARHGVRAMSVVECCGGRIEIEGGHNLSRLNYPVVFVANHMSMLETLILPALVLLYNDTTIVVKQSLIDRPFFGEIMRRVGALGVGRTDPRQDLKVMLNGGADALKSGKSVIIFPQSTRLPIFDGSKFNSIGVKIAAKAGVPVVPVALKTDFFGVGRIIRDFGAVDRKKKVMFGFGEPMPSEMGRKEIHRKSIEFISRSLRSWGGEVIEGEGSDE